MQSSDSQANRICRIVDGEALILDTRAGYYYALNTTATAILLALQEGKQPEDIMAYLHNTYDMTPSDFTSEELDALLARFKEEGLWEPRTNG